MGYLTKTADKTLKKINRQAYIPDWFMPAAYLLTGLSVLVVVVLALISGPPAELTTTTTVGPSATAPPVDRLGGDSGTPAVTDGTTAITDPQSSVPEPQAPDAVTAVVDETGAEIAVPAAALIAAQRAALALFTGEVGGLVFAEGVPAPAPPTLFSDPWISDVVTALRFPDGGWRIGFNVDPDRDGPELPRRVSVLIVAEGGAWVVGG